MHTHIRRRLDFEWSRLLRATDAKKRKRYWGLSHGGPENNGIIMALPCDGPMNESARPFTPAWAGYGTGVYAPPCLIVKRRRALAWE